MSIHVLSKLRPVLADAEQFSGQWRHIESGRAYTVLGAGKASVNRDWVDSVFYRNEETGELFAQQIELFAARFEPVQNFDSIRDDFYKSLPTDRNAL